MKLQSQRISFVTIKAFTKILNIQTEENNWMRERDCARDMWADIQFLLMHFNWQVPAPGDIFTQQIASILNLVCAIALQQQPRDKSWLYCYFLLNINRNSMLEFSFCIVQFNICECVCVFVCLIKESTANICFKMLGFAVNINIYRCMQYIWWYYWLCASKLDNLSAKSFRYFSCCCWMSSMCN